MPKIILFLVLAGALVGGICLHQRYQKEKQRQAEVARQAELARQEKAKAEAARIEQEYREAEKKRREEALRAREEAKAAAQKKREEEKARREQEKRAAEEKARSDRRGVCEKVLAVLDGGVLRPWTEARDEDRPDRAKGEKTFYCLMPDGEGSRMLIEQKLDFGRTVAAKRIDSTKENEAFSPESFDRTVTIFPNLLINGDRVYFRPAHADEEGCPVPTADEPFNPSEHDFGIAYDLVKASGLKTDAFVYDVYFRPFNMSNDVLVATVPFGKTATLADFTAKVGAWVKRNKAALAKAKAKQKTPQKVWKRQFVFTDKIVVKKRVDGVTEVPRTYVSKTNLHRYVPGSREYLNEEKKEEVAKQKWQALYDKAQAEEEKEKALKEAGQPVQQGSTGNPFLDAGSVFYRLHAETTAKQ